MSPSRLGDQPLVRVVSIALSFWAVFAILSIWAPVEVLIFSVVGLSVIAGVILGAGGVAVSSVTFAAISGFSELVSPQPLSAHRFLAEEAIAIVLVVFCGLIGYAGHVLLRRVMADHREA
jgi:hypothetical protein